MIVHVIFGVLLFFEGLSKRERCYHGLVTIEDITQHSAILYWKPQQIRESKIVCAGIRQYVTTSGKNEVDLDTVTQFVPKGIHKAFLSQLQPNFNYSCIVETETDGELSERSRPLRFSTKYAAPEAPNSPFVASRSNSKEIDIILFPSSTKYGPIDGYEVQFHVITAKTGHSHGQLEFGSDMTKPGGALASIQAAHSAKYPVSFSLAFRNSSLPRHITISDSLLQGSVRSGITYCVITAVYTELYDREMESEKVLLYSLSVPSQPFSLTVKASNEQLYGNSILQLIGKHLFKWSMTVGVISSNLILLYFLLVGCCVMRVVRSRLVTNTPYNPSTSQSVTMRQPFCERESNRSRYNMTVKGRNETGDTNKVDVSGSSLIFVPRGLSPSQSYSTAPDLAPDLEMDMYGISYSLSETQS